MKKILTATLLAVLSWMAVGCTAESDEMFFIDLAEIFNVKNAVFSSFIRFEDLGKNNMLASWNDVNPKPGYTEFQWSEYPCLSVTCVRMSDGAEMTLETPSWFVPENKEQEQIFGTGPLLHISWLDMDLRTGRNRPQTYDEVYTLTLRNTRDWEEDETHDIRWTVHVEDGHFSATRCQLDPHTLIINGEDWEDQGRSICPWESDAYRFLYPYLPTDHPMHLVSGLFNVKQYDYLIDWAPVNLYVQLQDQEGNDLLDPNDPQHNYIDGTTITFRGETFQASRLWYEQDQPFIYPQDTRALLSTLYGLFFAKSSWFTEHSDGYALYFGEIDGEDDMDEDLVLTWPDGQQNVIHYHCSDHKGGKNHGCTRWYELDGVRQESNRFLIRR